ncbi:hypothetical protein WG899_18775 [Paucibacter sp. AS339]|uniref:hypothetical protein n=1 Tax=Paucibacter hankyongi TaxID=3133434 RepID=UPI00309C3D83
MSSTDADLPKLAIALEYADLAAAHYLAGGSDHAARLLAAAAEQVLGDLARLLGPHHTQSDEVQTLLARIAMRYKAPPVASRNPPHRRGHTPPLQFNHASTTQQANDARQATVAYLRAAWYTLESMGLDAVVPLRLQQAVDQSTIYAVNEV